MARGAERPRRRLQAAHVSGVAAMVLASGTVEHKRTPSRVAAVTRRLRRTARSIGQPTTRQGAGLVDAALATEPRGQAHATGSR